MKELHVVLAEIKKIIEQAAIDGIVSFATINIRLEPGVYEMPGPVDLGSQGAFKAVISGATLEGATEWDTCKVDGCSGIILLTDPPVGLDSLPRLRCANCGRAVPS